MQQRDKGPFIVQAQRRLTARTEDIIIDELTRLWTDWRNLFIQEHAANFAEVLRASGVEVQIQHFTGDSSYPTEYTIRYQKIHAIGPTFDLAFLDFVKRLLAFVPAD